MKITLITFSAKVTEKQMAELHQLGEVEVIHAEKWSAEQVISQAPDTEILIVGPSGVEKMSRELLTGLKRLKFVTILSVGTNWVDISAAEELGIPISNIKGANSESVAEHAWGMILDLAKRITEINRDAISKGAYKYDEYLGVEVYGKTIGIIGLGDIGKKVARIAHGFDMRVIGINKSQIAVDGVEQTDLPTLLQKSDVIVICVPLTKETTNMISHDEVARMKKDVIIVNPSRPEVTDKAAILAGLSDGTIFGFGIETDVMQPIPADDPYLTHPRIIATPHNAFNTVDAEVKSFDAVIENVKSFIAGNPQNLVTLRKNT